MCAQVSLGAELPGGNGRPLLSLPEPPPSPAPSPSAAAPAASLRVAASPASHLLKRPSLSARDSLLAVMKRSISCFYL